MAVKRKYPLWKVICGFTVRFLKITVLRVDVFKVSFVLAVPWLGGGGGGGGVGVGVNVVTVPFVIMSSENQRLHVFCLCIF